MESLDRIVVALPFFGLVAVLVLAAMWIGGRIWKLRVREEVGEKGNVAVGVFFAGYLVAVVVAVSGVLFGRGAEPAGEAWLWVVGEGSLIVILMSVSAVLHDKLLFRQFDVGREIAEDRNLGAAFCLVGSMLASGLVLNGAATGFSDGLVAAMRDTAIFWGLGQVVLGVAVWVHVRSRRHDLRQLVGREDNPAVGLALGSFLVGIGLVVRAAIGGSGIGDLGGEVLEACVRAAFGLLVLSVVRSGLKVWMYPKVDLDLEISVERNVGAAALVAGAYLGTGILLGVVL